MKKRFLFFSLILFIVACLSVALSPCLRFVLLKAVAPLDVPCISYHLGDYYYKGKGTESDLAQAEHWYKKATKRNHAKAMYKLGNLYSHRHGIKKGAELEEEFWRDIPQDLEKAIKWYTYAGEFGYVSGYVRLGYFNRCGVGMPIDYARSLSWYKKAAKIDSKTGAFWLGYFYSHGLDRENEWENIPHCWDNVPKNYQKALKWYLKAAAAGHKNAQYLVGFMHSHGAFNIYSRSGAFNEIRFKIPGIPIDYKKAIYWFTKAAEQGHRYACRKLGFIYRHGGPGVAKDPSAAFSWYMKGAEKEDAVSMRRLAHCYEDGTGTQENMSQAMRWYSKAARLGDALAHSRQVLPF